jgi:hypothetical protein
MVSLGITMEVSFVNSINTSRGGTHVSYITDQAELLQSLRFFGIYWDSLGFKRDFNGI